MALEWMAGQISRRGFDERILVKQLEMNIENVDKYTISKKPTTTKLR